MEVELLDRLNAEALILTVRWTESSTRKREAATVCVHLRNDEITDGGFDPTEEASIEIPDRVRCSAMSEAKQIAEVLSGLYQEMSTT